MSKPLSNYGPGNWEIIIPQATTNLFKNPSFETNLTGWSACGSATLTRDSTSQKFGVYSMKIVTTAAASDGANASFTMSTCATQYTFSAWVFGQSGLTYEMDILTDGSTVANASFAGSGVWGRHEITGISGSKNDESACAAVKVFEDTVTTFFADAMQVESASAATTYCDGEQEGCRWTAASHGSTSQRSGQSRAGGAIVDLRDDYGILVRQQPGTGMPPMQNIQTNIGLQDGGLFQRTLADTRTFTLEGVVEGSSIHTFHQFRQQLINAIQPNLTGAQQPVLLRYTGVSHTINQIKAHYDSGLELTEAESGIEFVSVRFISYDPFWEEAGDEAATLATQVNVTGCNLYVRSASSGAWQGIAAALDDRVSSFVEDQDGNLFVGGWFEEQDGASDIRGVAKYDTVAGTFSALDQGLDDSDNVQVHELVLDSAENLYAVGHFTTAGSITSCAISKYDGNAWNQIGGTGACPDNRDNGAGITAITIGNEGNIYVGGGFSVIGGASFNRFAQFNGAAWIAAGSCNGMVRDLKLGLDNNIYATGSFTEADGSAASRIAFWNTTDACWTAMSTCGLRTKTAESVTIDEGRDIGIGLDGKIFVAGKFEKAGGVTACGGITEWNGTGFKGMGDIHTQSGGQAEQENAYVNQNNGNIYVFGNMRELGGGLVLPRGAGWAIWNGSFWNAGDLYATTSEINAAIITKNGDLYLGGNGVGAASAIGFTSVTNNGTNDVKPILQISVPTSSCIGLYKFANATTGDEINFNLGLQPGETVELDLEKLTFTSRSRGNLLGNILPTSSLASFRLLPGANQIGLFMASIESDLGGNASANLRWKKRHWSIDAGSSI